MLKRIRVEVNDSSDIETMDFDTNERAAGVYAAGLNLMGHRTLTIIEYMDGDILKIEATLNGAIMWTE